MRTVVCHGGSMRPWVRPGDRVAVVPVEPKALRRGQIAVFRGRRHEDVIHRVVATAGGIVTQGDNARRPDGPIAPERIVGKAVGIYARGRVRRFTRLGELCALTCAPAVRGCRRMAHAVLGTLAPLAFPVLPVRTVLFLEEENTRAIAAFLFRRKIAVRRGGPAGERVWIHPVFRKTALSRRLRAAASRP